MLDIYTNGRYPFDVEITDTDIIFSTQGGQTVATIPMSEISGGGVDEIAVNGDNIVLKFEGEAMASMPIADLFPVLDERYINKAFNNITTDQLNHIRTIMNGTTAGPTHTFTEAYGVIDDRSVDVGIYVRGTGFNTILNSPYEVSFINTSTGVAVVGSNPTISVHSDTNLEIKIMNPELIPAGDYEILVQVSGVLNSGTITVPRRFGTIVPYNNFLAQAGNTIAIINNGTDQVEIQQGDGIPGTFSRYTHAWGTEGIEGDFKLTFNYSTPDFGLECVGVSAFTAGVYEETLVPILCGVATKKYSTSVRSDSALHNGAYTWSSGSPNWGDAALGSQGRRVSITRVDGILSVTWGLIEDDAYGHSSTFIAETFVPVKFHYTAHRYSTNVAGAVTEIKLTKYN